MCFILYFMLYINIKNLICHDHMILYIMHYVLLIKYYIYYIMNTYTLKEGSIDNDPSEFKVRMGVVGYRNYNNYEHIKKELDDFQSKSKNKIDLIVSGGCTGVDTLAERWADED